MADGRPLYNEYPHMGRMVADTCEVDIDYGSQKVRTTLMRDTSR
jgi:hypothetical protein